MVVQAAGKIRSGELVAFCKVVAVAPALVRRDGRVQADGRPCDHARLGAAEVELDAACGPEAIERVAAGVNLTGKIKAKARREMSIAFTIRATLLMTLMPQADARHVMGTLLGDLLAVPWRREHAVPSGTVLSRWRTAIGPAPLQQLKQQWLATVTVVGADHDPGPPGIDVGGGQQVGAIDGTVTRMPDTKANRRRYGTAGTAGSGFPQIRSLHASDAFTRAGRAVVTGPAGGDKAEAEQKLLDRMLIEYLWAFTKNQLWIMDRNFPGVPRITRMIAKTHVLIRVKSDIRLERIGGFAPDGSWLARMSGGGMSLTVRVIEYHVTFDGETTPELFCLITDLIDHEVHPAGLLAAAYRWRWDGWSRTPCARSPPPGSPPTGTGTAHERSRAVNRSGTPRPTSPLVPSPPRSVSAAPPQPEQGPNHPSATPATPSGQWNPATPARPPGPHHAPDHPGTASRSAHNAEDHQQLAGAPRTASSPWHWPQTSRRSGSAV